MLDSGRRVVVPVPPLLPHRGRLPPYCPDLNPIEFAFSKLKGLLRSAEKRTIDGLWDFLGKALDAFAPGE